MQTDASPRLDGFRHISEVSQTAISNLNKIRNGKMQHILTRWSTVNKITQGFQLGEQIVIAARPGVGKSATVNMIAQDVFDTKINPILSQNVILLYWSWEMPDYQQVYRMLSSESQKTVKELTSCLNPIDDNTFQYLQETSKKYRNYPIFFRDTPINADTWSKVLDKVNDMYPDKYIINIIDHTRLVKKNNHFSEEQKITEFMEVGVEMKNKIGCTNIFLSQLNRDIEKEKDRTKIGTNPPVLSDIFGSDAVGQFANTVIILHRPEMYGVEKYLDEPTENMIFWHFVKQRDGDIGFISLEHALKYNRMFDPRPKEGLFSV